MTLADADQRPLSGYRVVDLVAGPLSAISRSLGELGANVLRLVDSRQGPSDHSPQEHISETFANLGKSVSSVDFFDAEAVLGILRTADLIIEDVSVAGRAPWAKALDSVRQARPELVIMTVSPFGQGNSCSDWQMSDPVLHALSGELSRSGIAGRAPLLPPGQISVQCAIAQGAYLAVLALYNSLVTGRGDHLDYSALDGAVQALDPGFGIGGSATMGRSARLLSRDRPVKGFLYPILPCADGFVRICLLAPRQWRGMFKWMGEPAEFASEAFNSTAARYKSLDLIPAIARFFVDKTRKDLEQQGQAHGVPISAMLSLDECLAQNHLKIRGAFADRAVSPGVTAPFPNGVIEIDGQRMTPDAPQAEVAGSARPAARPLNRPLEGLKVLDLGVIVVGAEQSRLLADMGADVIKIESSAFPDGTRQSYLPYELSAGFAAGHRNKRSLGLNLKDPAGIALFKRLAADADLVLSNFKPGVMEGLGLGPAELARLNPRIICVDSSAFGSTGPWSNRMGYGPLVRASAGLTGQWRYPDDPESYSDSITIYPDHVAARAGATAALALLIRRLRTHQGGSASISQAEVMLSQLGAQIATAHLVGCGVPGFESADGPPDAPWGVFQAAGEDEWCVVTVRGDEDWSRLLAVLKRDDLAADTGLGNRSGRLAARERIDRAVADWMAHQDADQAMRTLQAAGVPAARMLRVADQPLFSYYQERRFFRQEHHPYLPEDLLTERHHAVAQNLPEPDNRPAPLMGEQSVEVLKDWLDLADDAIADLISQGVIEPTPSAVFDKIAKTLEAHNNPTGETHS